MNSSVAAIQRGSQKFLFDSGCIIFLDFSHLFKKIVMGTHNFIFLCTFEIKFILILFLWDQNIISGARYLDIIITVCLYPDRK